MADACEHPETEVRLEWSERWLFAIKAFLLPEPLWR